MGKMGQPVDRNAMEAKRMMAVRLLQQGVSPGAVRQQLSVSKTWIYKVRQESIGAGLVWDGVERRSGRDRRLDAAAAGLTGSFVERRSGRDRRVASVRP